MYDEISLIITLPSAVEWQDYISELLAAATGQVLNFKVAQFPKNVRIGDKCYLVHRGKIKGWMPITGFSEKEFTCTTTGKRYKGKFIERSGRFRYLEEDIPYEGFQGFRYFNLNEYKEKLRQKALDEMFDDNQGDVIELGDDIQKISNIPVKRQPTVSVNQNQCLSSTKLFIKSIQSLPSTPADDTVLSEIDLNAFKPGDLVLITYDYNTDILESEADNAYNIKQIEKISYDLLGDQRYFEDTISNGIHVAVLVSKPVNIKILDALISKIKECGYFIVQKNLQPDMLTILLEPYEGDDIRNQLNTNVIYHITPKYNFDEIMKYGLLPKGSDKNSHHPNRIYFFYRFIPKLMNQSNCIFKDLKAYMDWYCCFLCARALPEMKTKDFAILAIDVNEIPKNVKFFQDARNVGAVFITEPLPASVIKSYDPVRIPDDYQTYVT